MPNNTDHNMKGVDARGHDEMSALWYALEDYDRRTLSIWCRGGGVGDGDLMAAVGKLRAYFAPALSPHDDIAARRVKRARELWAMAIPAGDILNHMSDVRAVMHGLADSVASLSARVAAYDALAEEAKMWAAREMAAMGEPGSHYAHMGVYQCGIKLASLTPAAAAEAEEQ